MAIWSCSACARRQVLFRIDNQCKASMVRFSDDEMETMALELATLRTSRAKLMDARAARCASPLAPLVDTQQRVIDNIPTLPSISEAGHVTDFVRTMARHLDIFRRLIIILEGDPDGRCFVFLFATQRPCLSYFAIADQVQPHLPMRQTESDREYERTLSIGPRLQLSHPQRCLLHRPYVRRQAPRAQQVY